MQAISPLMQCPSLYYPKLPNIMWSIQWDHFCVLEGQLSVYIAS